MNDEQRARKWHWDNCKPDKGNALVWTNADVAAYASEREQAARADERERCAKLAATLYCCRGKEIARAIRALAPAANTADYCCGDPNCRGHLVGEPAASKEAEPGNG